QALAPAAVRDLDVELRDLYFYIEDEAWNPRLPELRNTDGDKLVFTKLTYRLRCSPRSAFDRLVPLSRASAEDSAAFLNHATMTEAGDLQAVSLPWNKKGNRL